jgi:hypothetical protein
MMDFVSWDDDIPNMMGKTKIMFQTTNQICILIYHECGYTAQQWKAPANLARKTPGIGDLH